MSRKMVAVTAIIDALRKAGNQSWRSRELEGDTTSTWSCWNECLIVIRVVRMLLSSFGIDIV